MLLVPALYKDKHETIREYKYVTYSGPGQNIRLDNIRLKYENNKKFLERFTHFGKIVGPLFDISDFTYSKTDLITGHLESIEASVTNCFDNGYSEITTPYNFIGIDGEKEKDMSYHFNKSIYNINKLEGYQFRNAKIVDNVNLPMNTQYFEDAFNIDYCDTIGNLMAIISNASLSVPFRCDVILDSKYGFNIKNINLLLKDSDVQVVFKHEFKAFSEAIKILYRSFKNNCTEDNRNIRIYSSIREFDTFLKITDIDMRQSFDVHLNNSDHSRTMMTTLSHMGKNYMNTDSFGDLIETKCNMLIPSMFESEDRRFSFENNDYSDNFPTSYI